MADDALDALRMALCAGGEEQFVVHETHPAVAERVLEGLAGLGWAVVEWPMLDALLRKRLCTVCTGESPSWDGHDVNPPCVGTARAALAPVWGQDTDRG